MTELFFQQWNPNAPHALVFIHAFPLHQEMWKPQISSLPENIGCVSYDIRGMGKSPVGDGQFTMEDFVDDLIGLLDQLRIDCAVLCGLSIGGYISLRAVEKYPERVSGLVLCNTKSEADDNEGKLKRVQAIRKIKKEGVGAFAEDFVPKLLSENTKNENPELLSRLFEIVASQNPLGLCGAQLAMLSRGDTSPALSRIRVPTLIIHGEADAVIPFQQAQSLQEKIPNARLAAIKAAGHLSNLENPAEFNRHLLEHLKDYAG